MADRSLDLTVEGAEKLRRNIAKYAAKYGVSLGFVANDQMRLWVNDVMRNMPPKSFPIGRRNVTNNILYDPGKDHLGLFVPVTKGMFNKAVRQPGVFAHFGAEMKIHKKKLKGTEAELIQAHKYHRTKAGGVKVPKVPGQAWGGRYVVNQASYRKFQKRQWGKVGLLKAQFAKAAQYYARKSNNKDGTPAWVRKRTALHGGLHPGHIDKDGNGLIKAVNEISYAAERSMGEAWWKISEQKRQKDLAKGALKRMSKLAARYKLSSEAA